MCDPALLAPIRRPDGTVLFVCSICADRFPQSELYRCPDCLTTWTICRPCAASGEGCHQCERRPKRVGDRVK